VLRQFDVHRFTGRVQSAFPYIVVVQSNALRALKRRLAIPFVRRDALAADYGALFPEFTLEGTVVVLSVLDIASFPPSAFGQHVTSLATEGDSIIAAIDIVIARGFS
jgi:toxin CcdB